MNEGSIVSIIISITALLGVIIPQLISSYMQRKKTSSDVNKNQADISLSEGSLIEKYQAIATKQANDNIQLAKENEEMERENKELMGKVDQLQNRFDEFEQKCAKKMEDLQKGFEKSLAEEREENGKMRDWARRLVYQLESWNLRPVPFDVEDAKKSGLSLGDYGSNKGEKS